jgi:hypothetical protein
VAAGGSCGSQTGVSVEVEGSGSKKFVCNGEAGEPWAAGGILPSEATETGSWSLPPSGLAAEGSAPVPVSFGIPLEEALPPTGFEFLAKEASSTTNCPGSAVNPEAAPGMLCVYAGTQLGAFQEVTSFDPAQSFSAGVGKTGAILRFVAPTESGVPIAWGTWAVTAP